MRRYAGSGYLSESPEIISSHLGGPRSHLGPSRRVPKSSRVISEGPEIISGHLGEPRNHLGPSRRVSKSSRAISEGPEVISGHLGQPRSHLGQSRRDDILAFTTCQSLADDFLAHCNKRFKMTCDGEADEDDDAFYLFLPLVPIREIHS
jgi:hypothetical protein